MALEVLAGNLPEFAVRIVDLKAAPDSLSGEVAEFRPELVGITGVTCEANTVLRLAGEIKESCGATVAVGGIHASDDPEFFNQPGIDYLTVGLGKASFRELALNLAEGLKDFAIDGIAATRPGQPLK